MSCRVVVIDESPADAGILHARLNAWADARSASVAIYRTFADYCTTSERSSFHVR